MTCKPLSACLITVFVYLGSFISNCNTSQAGPIIVTIPASSLWVDTGLYLTNAESVYVTASGLWNSDTSISPWNGPDGDSLYYPATDGFYSGALGASLIGYIGSDPYQGNWGNSAFFPQPWGYLAVGSSRMFVANEPGEFWLGFNDDAVTEGVGDNAGSVTAQVVVSPPSTNCELSGLVYNTSGDPLPGALVLIDSHYATTANDGSFYINNLSSGTFDLNVTKQSYSSFSTSVDISNGSNVRNFLLKPTSQGLPDVTSLFRAT